MKENWMAQLRYYSSNFGESEYTYYFPIGVFVCFILIFFIHHRFFKSKGRTVTDNLIKSAFYSSLITIGIFLSAIFILKRFTSFFAVENCELVCLLLLLLLCGFIVFFANKGKNLFGKEKEHLLIGYPVSNRLRNDKLVLLRKLFNRRKFYFLLILLPFLILLLKPNSKYLYSIVVDNSASMDAYLGFGVNSFGSALGYSPKDAQYVLSYLPQCSSNEDCLKKFKNLKTNLNQIGVVNKLDSLGSTTFIFDNSNSVINTISQDIQISGISSPISEMIWQNYLVTKSVPDNFKEKRLIVLTDGMDNLYFPNPQANPAGVPTLRESILDRKTNDGISPRDYFQKIYFINQGGDASNYLLGDSNEDVLDGSDAISYYKSVQQVMSLISFDLFFVYFCLAILALTAVLLLLINPKITN